MDSKAIGGGEGGQRQKKKKRKKKRRNRGRRRRRKTGRRSRARPCVDLINVKTKDIYRPLGSLEMFSICFSYCCIYTLH